MRKRFCVTVISLFTGMRLPCRSRRCAARRGQAVAGLCAALVWAGMLTGCGEKTPVHAAPDPAFGKEPLTEEQETAAFDPERQDAVYAVIREVMESCADVVAENAFQDEMAYQIPMDAFSKVEDAIAGTGVAVLPTGEYRQLYNWEKVAAFYDGAKAGKDVFAVIARVGYYEVGFTVLSAKEGTVTVTRGDAPFDKPEEMHLDPPMVADTMTLTEEGHLMYHLKGDISYVISGEDYERGVREGTPENNYWGYCVLPHDPALMELCRTYVDPLSMVRGGALMENWDGSELGQLNLEVLFADIFRASKTGGKEYMWSYYPTSPHPTEDDPDALWLTVPEQEVEGLMGRYFTFSPEALRKSGYYDPTEKAYIFKNRYGYQTPPADWPEVTASQKNSDGSVTLTVHCVELATGTECVFTSRLTVQPQADGGWHYLSNQTDAA